MTIDPKSLRAAWGNFVGEFPAQFGVTLAYNSHHLGTAGPCYRFSSDGECLRVRGSGVVGRYGTNRVAGARRIALEQVHRDLDQLHGRVDRALLGTRFHRLPADRRTAFIGFIEHATSNVHVHLSWRVPEARVEEFASIVTEAWKATGPAATIDVQPIRDSGWGHYVAKDQHGWTQEAALFVASHSGARA